MIVVHENECDVIEATTTSPNSLNVTNSSYLHEIPGERLDSLSGTSVHPESSDSQHGNSENPASSRGLELWTRLRNAVHVTHQMHPSNYQSLRQKEEERLNEDSDTSVHPASSDSEEEESASRWSRFRTRFRNAVRVRCHVQPSNYQHVNQNEEDNVTEQAEGTSDN